MLMEATNVPSKVPVLFNCPPFKFHHVPFRVQPSPASISHYSLPHPVYHSVSMNYLLFSLVLPDLCLCCCSFYIECPSSLISMMNFYSLFKTHLRGYLLCAVILNLPSKRAIGDSLLSAPTVTSLITSWQFEKVDVCLINFCDLYRLA